jgi:hypothetical protein
MPDFMTVGSYAKILRSAPNSIEYVVYYRTFDKIIRIARTFRKKLNRQASSRANEIRRKIIAIQIDRAIAPFAHEEIRKHFLRIT